jgi:hypothetical protein
MWSTLALKAKLQSLFKEQKKAVTPQDQPSPSHAITVLSADEDASSIVGLSWLLKCIFRENELYEYAEAEIGEPLNACKTYEQANRLVYDHFRNKISGQDLNQIHTLDCRAFQSVLTHQIQTRKNQKAYNIIDQSNVESGCWPNPSWPANGRSLYTEFPFRRKFKFITPKTSLVSAGSCFAMEIALELQRGGFNYVVTERNSGGRLIADPAQHIPSESSAAWGIIFNTPSFRQLVERAFGLRELPRILWQLQNYYMDPFREEIKFADIEEYAGNYDKHVASARDALMQAEVFIITLGLNEIWTFKMDNSVFSRSPWRIAPSFVEHTILSVEENIAELQIMLDTLRRFNPNVKLIVTLSPVPLHATFLRESYHVVEANMHSKAVLRVAAQEFVEKNDGVYYFPSFESVLFGSKDPWCEDQRHVNTSAVSRVMEMFREMFVA